MIRTADIETILEEHCRHADGVLGLAFFDLESGTAYDRFGRERFPTASTFKVFLLAELYREIEAGILREDTRIRLKESDKREGSGILQDLKEGAELTLYDYALLMMSLSDNTATDLLFALVGPDPIRQNILEPLGLKDTRVDLDCSGLLRECFVSTGCAYDPKASYLGLAPFMPATVPNDFTSPLDMCETLRRMAEDRLCSPFVSRRMKYIMERCQMNHRIPRLLPRGTNVIHKTGTLDRIANDVGIIETDAGRYILVCYYNGNRASEEEYAENSDNHVGEDLIAAISRDIYRYYIRHAGHETA